MKREILKICTTIFALLISIVVFSQYNIVRVASQSSISTKNNIKSDTIVPLSLKYDFKSNQQGGLFLKKPTDKVITYDKKINKFIIVEKIGSYQIGTPIFLTPKEYDKYKLDNDVKTYFQQKVGAVGGKGANKEQRKNLLPKYYVNSKFFESVFGGNEVEVNPSGQVSVKLGVVYQKTENPQISVENQSSFTFDFDQQISTSLQAKVGTRLKVMANYDTQSTFDFQNIIKLEYTPDEDDILQKLDAGNVNLPIKNSLINGAQALFGVRADFQFGRTTIRTAYSQQNSQAKTVVAKGGAVIEPFELQATDYDNDRHFFLSHFFRKTYDKSLQNYPLISSPINITRVEVWVTNKNQNVKDYRSIVAFADIGETSELVNETTIIPSSSAASVNISGAPYKLPSNDANNINGLLSSNNIRKISTLTSTTSSLGMKQGLGYTYLQNARKLQPNEYRMHPQLGFISLNSRLNDGEVLAVAYEYTVVGATNSKTVFKVGEFSNDGVKAPNNIAVKLLRSELLTTVFNELGNPKNGLAFPTWKLMMKNVYSLGTQLKQDGFRFEVLYRDDANGVLQNSFQNASQTSIKDRTLLSLLSVDRLDQGQYAVLNGDGFFDYVEGVTVNSQRGCIFFPETEPFGESLKAKLSNTDDQKKYVFEKLYLTTKAQAKNEYQNKDKFFLKGYLKSETSRGIRLGAFNVPRGSVKVTAGGRQLVEGVDYVVDYQMGVVQILDPGLEASGVPINARLENNSFFSQQRKSFLGVDIEHKISEELVLGGTFLNVKEKPITPKINYGAEPINNIMLGFNIDYNTEVPYFTKLANKLPFVDTEVPSNLSVRGDFAYLIPGSPKGIDINGTATSYLDDFEATQMPINLSSPSLWSLASTPLNDGVNDFGGEKINQLAYNNKRAKLAWYNVDQLFYSSGRNRPKSINNAALSRDEVRQVSYSELFPNTDLDITQLNLVRTLDLAYYPSERGPYNFNTNSTDVDFSTDGKSAQLKKPNENWGGIMRALTTNNFEQANVEYVQFWLLDPFENYSITNEEGLPQGVNPNDLSNQVGELRINLGNLSEDILADGYKQYENGLPTPNEPNPVYEGTETVWGKAPKNPSILYAFNVNNNDRSFQDIGLDGLNDEAEKSKFPIEYKNFSDPAGDNFQFFRGGSLENTDSSILTRYKNYNGTEGNSPTLSQSGEAYPTSSSTYPDVEDINKDQTMNTTSGYFEYKVPLDKTGLQLGQNYIVDVKSKNITLPNGTSREAKWYQFRIPIRNGSAQAIGGISDFNSIRFMRMYLTGFKIPVVLRLGELELVRGDWRRYTKDLADGTTKLTDTELNNFEVGVASIEQNNATYSIPPGISRELLQGTSRVQRQNEQSVTLKVKDLPANETRTIYKNISIDLRRYNNLKMFLHAEALNGSGVSDNEIVAVIRLGTDLNENYYEIEKPLKLSTVLSKPTPLDAWPEANNVDVLLGELAKLKLERDGVNTPAVQIYSKTASNGLKIKVKGNPTLAKVRTVMLGVKNGGVTPKTSEVWFNELRAVGFDNKGGWASVLSADANFADVANVSMAGSVSTVGFGSVEQRVQERSLEETKEYNLTTSVELGKMMPKKWNMQVPVTYIYGEEFKDPKYNPQYQDITQEDVSGSTSNDVRKKAQSAQDYTRRKGISLINVKKNKSVGSKSTPKFYDVENVSVSYAYNEEIHRDFNIKKYRNQNLLMGTSYNFNFKPWSYQPFKKSKRLKSRYWRLIKDINISPVPKVIGVNSKINRNYNLQQSRNLISGFSEQPVLKQRKFMFDWDYIIGFDLTKSIKLNFNATNNYIYDSFGRDEELEIFDKVFEIGRKNNYHQKLNGTYKIPINKIPYLDFLSADYAYSADFDWQGSSQSPIFESGTQIGTIEDKVGNMVQNLNTHNITANLNLGRFYKTLGLDKLLLKGAKKQPEKTGLKKPKQQVVTKAKLKKNATTGQKFLKGTYDILTSLKNLKVSYSENNGTSLQGYKPSVGFLGRDNYGGGLAPTLGFVFGSQTEIINHSIANNWLVTRNVSDQYYNQNYIRNSATKLDYNLTIKPFKTLTIDVKGNTMKTSSLISQLDVIDYSGGVVAQNPDVQVFETGNHTASHFMLGTMFKSSDELFSQFLDNRQTISNRLAYKNGLSNSQNLASPGYKVNGQQAMLPAFVAAYSGKSANSVKTGMFKSLPSPNWTLRFNGLMKYKWFKKKFSSFTLSHGYNSLYTISNFTNNLQYKGKASVNKTNNYQPEKLMTSAMLVDEFSPLVRVDMKMRNSFSFKGEIRKDRNLALNFSNNTLTDIKGTEYILGFGYKIKDVKFVTRISGKKETLKGDVNFRTDISLRKNLSLIRTVDDAVTYGNNQITGGETLLGFKFLAEYNLTKSLTAAFYYNHNTFKYAISTTFPRKSINAGVNFIYKLN